MITLDKLLDGLINGRCYSYPYCSCGEKMDRYGELVPRIRWDQWSPEEVYSLKLQLVTFISCIEAHCWDPEMRRWAKDQLSQPIFAEVVKEAKLRRKLQ